MVAPFDGAGGVVALAAPSKLYDPGEVLVRRLDPERLPWILTARTTTLTMFGETVLYVLNRGPVELVVTPAVVVSQAEIDAAENAKWIGHELKQDSDRGPGALAWRDLTGATVESACRRFFIDADGAPVVVFDKWTGERAEFDSQRLAMLWAENRTQGAELPWKGTDREAFEARHGSTVFRVLRASEGDWFASDSRFVGAHPLRQSPWFKTENEARAWCAIRAHCNVSGDPTSRDSHLLFVGPIPF